MKTKGFKVLAAVLLIAALALAVCGAAPDFSASAKEAPANQNLSPVSYTHLTLPTICSV